jgi:hypothetical protein
LRAKTEFVVVDEEEEVESDQAYLIMEVQNIKVVG